MGGLIRRNGSSALKTGEGGRSSGISNRDIERGSEFGDERDREEEDVVAHNNLQINASKTKELSWWWISAGVATFRLAPVSILGMDIDTVKSYKYLGVHLNDSPDWTDNTDVLIKKVNSRLFLLRRLRSFLWSAGTTPQDLL
ncbi:hypothetical protein L3Q82_000787 [Scortum barcoo]|uniref:Uncharacterized protein n=1 Tax=Scortum barcoo TaxID=214431 RepID=A0ACB8WEA6_9TELE|nr:hypothetical protein L3Q82_000787 [Scortum barcoo]